MSEGTLGGLKWVEQGKPTRKMTRQERRLIYSDQHDFIAFDSWKRVDSTYPPHGKLMMYSVPY